MKQQEFFSRLLGERKHHIDTEVRRTQPHPGILRTIKWIAAIAGGIALIFAAAHAHQTAGFGLPPPWEDESVFLWPALSFAQSSTLFSAHINPDRPVFFMLMGYSAVLGTLFKTLTFSLEAGRWLSFTWMLGVAGLLAWMVRRIPLHTLAWGLIAWFALSQPFVVAGNFVRPEAFCALLVCLAMALGPRRPWIALAVLGITPLMHPNGVWFVLAGLFAMGLIQPGTMRHFRHMDVLALGCMGLAWMLMGWFVVNHWDGFIHDFGFSLHAYPEPLTNKASRLLLNPSVTPFFIICTGALFYWRKRRPEYSWMAVLAATLLWVPTVRVQMWYAIYSAIGQVIALCLAIAIIAEWKIKPLALLRALAIITAGVGIFLLYREGALEGPHGWPRDMTWGWGMKTENPAVPYWAETDQTALLHALAPHLNPGSAARVMFLPKSDTLFFPDPATAGFISYQGIFTSVLPDIVVYRESRYLPEWVRSYYTNILFNAVGDRPGIILFQRDQSERWTLYIPDETVPVAKADDMERPKPERPVVPPSNL